MEGVDEGNKEAEYRKEKESGRSDGGGREGICKEGI